MRLRNDEVEGAVERHGRSPNGPDAPRRRPPRQDACTLRAAAGRLGPGQRAAASCVPHGAAACLVEVLPQPCQPPPLQPCCADQGCGRSCPSPAWGQATWTEIGYPSSCTRLRVAHLNGKPGIQAPGKERDSCVGPARGATGGVHAAKPWGAFASGRPVIPDDSNPKAGHQFRTSRWATASATCPSAALIASTWAFVVSPARGNSTCSRSRVRSRPGPVMAA